MRVPALICIVGRNCGDPTVGLDAAQALVIVAQACSQTDRRVGEGKDWQDRPTTAWFILWAESS